MVRACHMNCRSALGKAVQEGLIRINPAVGCKLPPKKAREMQVLTREEIQRFLIQAKAEGYFELFLLELTTGLRRGELLALQWDDLNLETGEVEITERRTDRGKSAKNQQEKPCGNIWKRSQKLRGSMTRKSHIEL